MKCRNCPAFWHTEDNGGCYINKLEDNKNGECKDGCRLGIKRIEKTIEEFQKQEDEFWTGYIAHIKEGKDGCFKQNIL